MDDELRLSTESDGVWICYYPGDENIVFFKTEIEALRCAVNYSMSVKFQTFGRQDK